MHPSDLIEERFAEIVRELKSARVAASPELREQVRAIAEPGPEPPPASAPVRARRPALPQFSLRRWTTVLVPAALVVALGSAFAVGLATSGSNRSAAPPTYVSDQAFLPEPLRAATPSA